jgi:hypothetical protein
LFRRSPSRCACWPTSRQLPVLPTQPAPAGASRFFDGKAWGVRWPSA